MQKKKSNSKVAGLVVLGTSLAAIAATAYFLFGPRGKKHRQQAKSWVIKMKGEIVEKLETMREITEPAYQEIIDTVASEYKKGKKASQPEIEALAVDLKKHWKSMSKLASSAKQKISKDASRVVKTIKKTGKEK